MKDEAFYKANAREARKAADRVVDPVLTRSWLQIAEDYDALADAVRVFPNPPSYSASKTQMG
jgi:hypothetical protein